MQRNNIFWKNVTLFWDAPLFASGYEIYMYSANQPQRLIATTEGIPSRQGSTSSGSQSSDVKVIVSGNTAFIVTGLENGTTYFFRIKAIGSQGESEFSNTVSARTSVVLGTEEDIANNLFKVYPNPSNGNFNLFISELKGKNAQINVLDMSGRVVFNQAISANGSLETELNLNLANGMYLLQVSTEKENLRKKIIMTK